MPCCGFTHELACVLHCPILRRIVPNARCIPRRRRSSSSPLRRGVPRAVRSPIIELLIFRFDQFRYPLPRGRSTETIVVEVVGCRGSTQAAASRTPANRAVSFFGRPITVAHSFLVRDWSRNWSADAVNGKRHLLRHRVELKKEELNRKVHATNVKNDAIINRRYCASIKPCGLLAINKCRKFG